MTRHDRPDSPADSQEFADQAEGRSSGAARELWTFVRQNRKWVLLPILVMLLAVSAIAILSGTAVAPLIYTLF